MARNPLYNGRSGLYPVNRIEKMTGICDNGVTYPSWVGNPTLWYKAGLTSSVDTAGYNTVVNGEYTRWYDYSGNSKNLTPAYSYAKFKYSSDFVKNGLYYFGVTASTYANMTATNTSTDYTSGKGTVMMVWKTAPDNVNSLWAFAKPAGTINRGYIITNSMVTIFGDTQTYTFANANATSSQWNVTVVSVDSAGSPNTYRNNGVQGATSAYSNPLGTGTQPIISFDDYNGVSVAEFMWFATPLSASNCSIVESYLKQRWCIDY